jgi:hypothetical protein
MKVFVLDIVNRIQQVILHPKTFWESRKELNESNSALFGGYVFPLILVAALAIFIGEFFRSAHFYIGFAAIKALRELILFSLQYFIAVYFTTILMKTFGGEKDLKIAQKLVAYSLTPFLLVSVVTGLIQFLYVIDVLGVYSFYIFWLGGKELLVLPEQKRDSYLLITIMVNFFVFSFLSVLLSKIITAYF